MTALVLIRGKGKGVSPRQQQHDSDHKDQGGDWVLADRVGLPSTRTTWLNPLAVRLVIWPIVQQSVWRIVGLASCLDSSDHKEVDNEILPVV